MTSGHHHTKPNGNRQPKHHEEVHGHQPISNRDSQTIPYGSRQAPHRGHKKQPMSQTRRRNVENVVGRDTGLEDVGTNVCFSAGYASSAAIEQEMANDLSRREASGGHTVHSKLTGKLIEKEQQLSAAVMIGGNSNKATIDTGKT